jgi:hypothetical protein
MDHNELAEWAELGKTLHNIDTRVTLLESDFASMASTHNWVRSIAVVLVIQFVIAALAFGRLSEQVNGLDLDLVLQNDATALTVLADHGTELHEIRTENARLRGAMDAMRTEIFKRTQDRFTSKDGDRHDVRIQRLENHVYLQDQ